MVQHIEELRPKLNIEILGDAADVIVLEEREVKIGQAWANHDVAACIASDVEALQVVNIAQKLIAICRPESRVRRSRYRKAGCLDVVGRIA